MSESSSNTLPLGVNYDFVAGDKVTIDKQSDIWEVIEYPVNMDQRIVKLKTGHLTDQCLQKQAAYSLTRIFDGHRVTKVE